MEQARRRGIPELFVCLSISISIAAAVAADIHVAVSGDDAADGSSATPVASLRRALDRVRELRAADPDRATPVVVEVAAGRLDDPRARWVGADIATEGCGERADLVITINSVLSDSDDENRGLLAAFRDAIPEGGVLAGLFASILAPLEMGYLQPDRAILDQVNLEECRFAERRQGITQIFYSPLRLRMVLAEAGFRLDRMEVVFLDSPELAQQARDYYGLGTDPDVMAWELFVEATAV